MTSSNQQEVNYDAMSPETVEQMLRMAERADEPGDFLPGQQVISDGKSDGVPMVAHSLESAGYIRVYSVADGEESIINRNMLPVQLRKINPETGQRAFTVHPPKVKPWRGTMKCLLNKDSENREHYDSLGLATCPKANLTSQFQVERHMATRHKQEWATITLEREQKERQEDREFQRRLLSAVPVREPIIIECDDCGESIEGQTQLAVTQKMKSHRKWKHTEDADASSG